MLSDQKKQNLKFEKFFALFPEESPQILDILPTQKRECNCFDRAGD